MENQITKSNSAVPAFVQQKMATLEGALEYAKVLCGSKLLPNHFYEKVKGSDGKMYPDYTKPKPESVVVVLQYGQEIGMSHMQAIQQLIPINQLVAIKGDGAKALIMGSGKCAAWKEEEIGSGDDYTVKITAKRKDTGEDLSRSFSVSDAKRAGLWITEDAASRNPSLKYSPWYKYSKRMLRYRALGFICRDLFSDVLQGVYIEEEARHIETDNTKFKTEDGIVVSRETKSAKAVDNAIDTKPVVVKSSVSKKITGKVAATDVQEIEENPVEVDKVVETPQNADVSAKISYDNLPADKIISVLGSQKESIFEWLKEKVLAEVGEDLDALYTAAGKNRTVGSVKTLIKTICEKESVSKWVNDELGIPLAENIEQNDEDEDDLPFESDNSDIVLPFALTEVPRSFDDVFDIMT